MARVKKLTLPAGDYDALVAAAGGADRAHLSARLILATGVSDAAVLQVTPAGDSVVLHVESRAFPENDCCWKERAPEWHVKVLP